MCVTERSLNKLSFALRENSCLGIVAESGSGKSMTAKGIQNPWLKTTGSAQNGCETELIGLEESRLRHIREAVRARTPGRHDCLCPWHVWAARWPRPLLRIWKWIKRPRRPWHLRCCGWLNIREPEQVVKQPHQLSGGTDAALYDRHRPGHASHHYCR